MAYSDAATGSPISRLLTRFRLLMAAAILFGIASPAFAQAPIVITPNVVTPSLERGERGMLEITFSDSFGAGGVYGLIPLSPYFSFVRQTAARLSGAYDGIGPAYGFGGTSECFVAPDERVGFNNRLPHGYGLTCVYRADVAEDAPLGLQTITSTSITGT